MKVDIFQPARLKALLFLFRLSMFLVGYWVIFQSYLYIDAGTENAWVLLLSALPFFAVGLYAEHLETLKVASLEFRLQKKLGEADLIHAQLKKFAAALAELGSILEAQSAFPFTKLRRADMLRVSGQIDQALMDMGLEDELPRINQARNEMRMRHLQWALFYKLEPYYKKKKVEIRAAIDSASALNGQERTDVITALQGRSNTLQTEEKSLGEVRDRAGSYAETLGILENSPVFSEEERGAMLQEVRPELEHIKHFDEHGTFLRPEVWTEGFPQEK